MTGVGCVPAAGLFEVIDAVPVGRSQRKAPMPTNASRPSTAPTASGLLLRSGSTLLRKAETGTETCGLTCEGTAEVAVRDAAAGDSAARAAVVSEVRVRCGVPVGTAFNRSVMFAIRVGATGST